MQDDPTVYQYDELFDDMNKKREEVKVKNKEDRKVRFLILYLNRALDNNTKIHLSLV